VPDKSGRAGSRPARRNTGFKRETELGRPSPSRLERRTILIVTNGSRTEVDYFEAVKREAWVRAAKVTVKFQAGAPDAVVDRAARVRDDSVYSEAWGVCDVDEYDVASAIANAEDQDVGLALSVPSFEVWLILHHTEGCPAFNDATKAGAYLKKFVGAWDKAKLDYADFSAGVVQAIARAQRLGAPPDANPSTAVWRLIKSLHGDKIPK
jgi:hypothetical protein